MQTAPQIIDWYLADLIAVHRHVGDAIDSHAGSEAVGKVRGAAEAVQAANAVLRRHHAALEAYAKQRGGTGVVGAVKESITAITGFLTGLYGEVRNQAASRMLRDDYTGLSFVMVCTEMLHATALAVGDELTAEITGRHMRELPPVITAITAAVPYAVVDNLRISGVPVTNPDAADQAARDHTDAWRVGEPAKP